MQADQHSVYTMDFVEDGHWTWHSSLFGFPLADYERRRIVKADAMHDDDAFADYVNFSGPTAAIYKR